MIHRLIASFSAIVILVVGLSAWSHPVLAEGDEMMLLDGKTWQQLSRENKLMFVWGMAHIIEFERQISQETWDPDANSFVPHLVKGLKGKTLNDVVIAIDNYYVVSTDRLDDPVVKAVVHAVVLPAL